MDEHSKYFDKIKEIFVNKKPNIVYSFDKNIESYNIILDLWKKFYLNINLILPFNYEKIIKEVFKFHLNTFDHVIVFQSNNLSNALLMCRVYKKYYNVIIPKIPISDEHESIIATFT